MSLSFEEHTNMHQELVSELRAEGYRFIGDYAGNPDAFIEGMAVETVYEAALSPDSFPIAWKRATISRAQSSGQIDAFSKRKREFSIGAQIGASFAKRYLEQHGGLI